MYIDKAQWSIFVCVFLCSCLCLCVCLYVCVSVCVCTGHGKEEDVGEAFVVAGNIECVLLSRNFALIYRHTLQV